jgi:outer membrane protein insertion porin family
LFLTLLAGCATWSVPGPNRLREATSEKETDIVLPSERQAPIVRGQDGSVFQRETVGTGDDYFREPMPVSGAPASDKSNPVRDGADHEVEPAQYYDSGDGEMVPSGRYGAATDSPFALPPPAVPSVRPGDIGYAPGPTDSDITQPFTGRYADLVVNVQEQQTGRFMFGVGVNSDAGLTAQVVVDEYNFDWRRFPRGVDDILNGTAWRGGGQRLRIEAVPGSELQRYLINFTEPYLLDTLISLNLSGYLYERRYFDWDEQRLGGRVGLGYRLTPDLSLSGSLRAENVNINDPRLRGIPELEEVLGDNSLFSGRVALTHDTRDSPFAPTEGHMFEISYEQVFGSFDYPRGVAEYERYFLVTERVDGSGRHVLGASVRAGFSGSETPLFENFFAGGYSTIRGFRFRGASPKNGDVIVGGEMSLLGSIEYLFPITADDMLKGIVFCDYGTIEEEIEIEEEDFRVSVGAGLRIFVPAMGPAPIAVDFAVPLAREETDRIQNFSFFIGFGRN